MGQSSFVTEPASRAVVSYAYWQTAMGGRDLGAGGTVLVDGQPVEVVGVTPRRFYGLAVGDNFDIALPFCQPKEDTALSCMAR